VQLSHTKPGGHTIAPVGKKAFVYEEKEFCKATQQPNAVTEKFSRLPKNTKTSIQIDTQKHFKIPSSMQKIHKHEKSKFEPSISIACSACGPQWHLSLAFGKSEKYTKLFFDIRTEDRQIRKIEN